MSIPKEYKKTLHSGLFPKDTKKYFVNMVSDSNKLHITNCKNYNYSKSAYEYIDFDTEKEARNFFNKFDKKITRCENCFRK